MIGKPDRIAVMKFPPRYWRAPTARGIRSVYRQPRGNWPRVSKMAYMAVTVGAAGIIWMMSKV